MLSSLRTAIPRRVPVARSFVSGARLQSASVHGNDPDLIEREKQKNLANKQHETSSPYKKHAPGWNEYLASEAEANVKADQNHTSTSEMTSQTIEYVKKRHASEEQTTTTTHGSSEADHEHAAYDKEELEGPLARRSK